MRRRYFYAVSLKEGQPLVTFRRVPAGFLVIQNPVRLVPCKRSQHRAVRYDLLIDTLFKRGADLCDAVTIDADRVACKGSERQSVPAFFSVKTHYTTCRE